MNSEKIFEKLKKASEVDAVQEEGLSVEKLPGDASTRKYYRISHQNQTSILMATDPFEHQGSKEYPFLSIQDHLKKIQVRVPEVYGFEQKKGWVLLEDLGDQTLLHYLKTVVDQETEKRIYQKVIDQLVPLQYYGSPQQSTKTVCAFHVEFDHAKFMWEVRHTVDHFYKKHLSRVFKGKDEEIILSHFDQICSLLAKQPRYLTHRDLHSRNLMVANDKNQSFVFIDFQDARLGLIQYDLASLLKDSYYQLSENQVEDLLHYYVARWEGITGERILLEDFRKVFDYMGIQRNFKAIGSFASFSNMRGNQTYLKYIGNTFESMRRALLKYPELSQLREVLFHYYYF